MQKVILNLSMLLHGTSKSRSIIETFCLIAFDSHVCRYYGNSAYITLEDYYSVAVLDKLYDEIDSLMSIVHQAGYKGDLWLGETSSSYGGGRALYSECFISGFMLV